MRLLFSVFSLLFVNCPYDTVDLTGAYFLLKSGKKQKSIAIYKSSLAEIRPVVCKKYLSGNNCQNMLTIICNGAMINLIEQAKFSKENDAKL